MAAPTRRSLYANASTRLLGMTSFKTTLLSSLVLLSCKHSNIAPTTQQPVHDTVFVPVATTFQYRDMSESSLNEVTPKDIPFFMGVWTITDIGTIGGSIEPDSIIKARLGKQLLLTKGALFFDFGSWTESFHNPAYRVTTDSVRPFEPGNRGTTLFYGYRLARQCVFFLEASDGKRHLNFEIIHAQQLVYLNDGKAYILTR